MKQNDSKNRTDFFTEIGIALRRDGYDTSVPDNGLLPVLVDRLPLCRISETGSVRYRDADIGSVEREDALHEVTQTAETVSEYMKLMVRIAFLAGWKAAGGNPPQPQKIFQIVHKKDISESVIETDINLKK